MKTKNIYFTAIFCLIATISLKSQIIVTDTIYIDKDATVSSAYPETNFGDWEFFESYLYNGKISETRRSYVYFDISGIPVGANINSARLHLFGMSHTANNKSYLQMVKSEWDESTINFKNQPYLLENNVILNQSTNPEENYNVDIRQFFEMWHSGIANNGLCLRIANVDLKLTNGLKFGSSDNSDLSKRPYCIVQYEIDIPTPKLISEDCNLIDMPLNRLLSAEQFELAERYEFQITEQGTGITETIIKEINSFRLTELSMPINFNTEYAITVRMEAQNLWSSYGDVCKNHTIKNASIGLCKLQLLSYEITGLTGGENIQVNIDLPDNVYAYSGGYCDETVSNFYEDTLSDPNIPQYSFDNGANNNITLNYYIFADCEQFDLGTVNTTFDFTVLINDSPAVVTDPIVEINAPVLVCVLGDCQNRIYNLAEIGVPFERTFNFYNTSGTTSFDGVVEFLDTVYQNVYDTTIIIDTIEISSPGSYDILDYIVNDSMAYVRLRVTNVEDSIIFKERVIVNKCTDEYNSITKFQLKYGCDSSNLCQLLQDTTGYFTRTELDPLIKPEIKYELLYYTDSDVYPNCWPSEKERVIKISNIGNGNAEFVEIWFCSNDFPGYGYSISHFDLTDIGLFSDISLIDSVDFEVVFPNEYNAIFKVKTLELFEQGDVLFIRYDEIVDCPDTSLYDTLFTTPIISNWEGFPSVRLSHPCEDKSSLKSYPPQFSYANWRHVFDLEQYFTTLTSTIDGNQDTWFEISNSIGLNLGQTQFIFDPENSEIQIELLFDPKIHLKDSNIYMSSVFEGTPIELFPDTIIIDYYDTFDCGGSKALAKFKIPDFWYSYTAPGHYNGIEALPIDTFSFFSNFKVNINVQSCCEPSDFNQPSKLTQNFFFVPDVICEDCKLPLASVSKEINIHCPGCWIPGWNTNVFDFERVNLGLADNNNNNFPDGFPMEDQPIDTSLVHIERVMIGDTIKIHLFAETSNGDHDPHMFENIGFDFLYGQFVIKSEIMDSLEFLGATGTYNDHTGSSYPINIDPSFADFSNSNVMLLDFNVEDINTYAETDFLSRFWAGESVDLELMFTVANNLVNDSTGNYFNYIDFNNVINMSGVPITGYSIMEDALNLDTLFFDTLTGAERSDYLYWCTGYDTQIIGIGFDFVEKSRAVNGFSLIPDGYNSPCYNELNLFYFTEVGLEFTPHNPTNDQFGNQMVWNSFSNELRNLCMLDTLTFSFPEYYEVWGIRFVNSQIFLDTVAMSSRYFGLYSGNHFDYDLSDAIIDDTSCTIFPSKYLVEVESAYEAFNQYFGYDETKRYRIYPILKMKDYHLTPDFCYVSTHSDSLYPVYCKWSGFPGATNGDTLFSRFMYSGDLFARPQAKLNYQVLSSVSDEGGVDMAWDVDLNTINPLNHIKEAGVIEAKAVNTFLYFESPSGNIIVDSVLWRDDDTNVPIVSSVGTNPVYGLGIVGVTWDNSQDANVSVFASFDCSTLEDIDQQDSLMVVYGWNCYNYPTSLEHDSVCSSDTMYFYVDIEPVGLQASISHEENINSCDTIDFDILIDATGSGGMNNIFVSLFNSEINGYEYVPGSAYLEYMDTIITFDPQVITADSLVWQFDTIGILQNFALGEMHFHIGIDPLCNFLSDTVNFLVGATNYCGFELPSVPLSNNQITIGDLPQWDSLSIEIIANNLTSCGDSTLVSITVNNLGDNPNSENNFLEIELPGSFVWSSGYPVVDNDSIIFLNIPGGLAPESSTTYNLYLINEEMEDCGTLDFVSSLHLASPYYCGGDTCIYEQDFADTAIITQILIVKPDVQFVEISPVSFCDTVNWQIQIELENLNEELANNIFIDFYCFSETDTCFLNTFVADSVSDIEHFIDTVDLTNICVDCNSIFAILNSDCICDSDTSVSFSVPDTLHYSIDTIIDNNCSSISIGEIGISVFGGIPNYEIFWSSGDNTEYITNLSSGWYSFTITDVLGCELIDSIEVEDVDVDIVIKGDSIVNAMCDCSGLIYIDSLDIIEYVDNVINSSASFTLTWSNADSTFYDTGFLIDSLCTGWYFVTVTDQNGCYIVDSFFVDEYQFDPVPVLSFGAYTIDEEFAFNESIMVPDGCTLIIDGITVLFSIDAGIEVEPGGELQVINGALLTNVCDTLWKGIHLNGDHSHHFPISLCTQPICQISNSTIQHAETAILSEWGAIIKASNTDFLDNIRDISFFNNFYAVTYAKTISGQRSFIAECNFETTGSWLYSQGLSPDYHVSLVNTRNMKLTANTFKNSADLSFVPVEQWGKGLVTHNSSFKVIPKCSLAGYNGDEDKCPDAAATKNRFENLQYGMKVEAGYLISGVLLKQAEFINNHRGALMEDFRNSTIIYNRFENRDNINEINYGLYLNGCTGYKLMENQFFGSEIEDEYDYDFGLHITNSGYEHNRIYRNTFENFNINELSSAIIGLGTNSDYGLGATSSEATVGLEYTCNDFSNYVRAMVVLDGEIEGVQGRQTYPFTPAENSIDHSGCGASGFDFYIEGSDMSGYKYCYNEVELPKALDCYSDAYISNQEGVVGLLYEACLSELSDDGTPPIGPGLEEAISIESEISLLTSQYDELMDAGDTEGLINRINTVRPNEYHDLCFELIEISPYVSDEVLTTFLLNSIVRPVAKTSVLLANSPLTTAVQDEINNSNLPSHFKQIIWDNQTGINPRLEKELEITELKIDKQEKVNNMVYTTLRNDSVAEIKDSVIVAMETLEGLQTKTILFQLLVKDENLSEAQFVLNELESNLVNYPVEKQQEVSEILDIYQIQLEIMQGDESTELSIIQNNSAFLQDIAETVNHPASIKAQLLLEKAGIADYPERIVIPGLGTKSTKVEQTNQVDNTEAKELVFVYPNPANDKLTVEYILLGAINEQCIGVYTLDGKLVKQVSIQDQLGIIKIDVSDIVTGNYLLCFGSSGIHGYTKQISIIH